MADPVPLAFPGLGKLHIKDLLIGAAAGFLLTGFIAVGAGLTVLQTVLQGVQIETSQLPGKVWFRWDKSIFVQTQCWFVDLTKISEAPRLSWMPLSIYMERALLKFGRQEITTAERAFCFDGYIEPPANSRVLAPDGTLLSTHGTWTFGPPEAPGRYPILLDGQHASRGYAVELLLYDGQVYAINSGGDWYVWSGVWTQAEPVVLVPPVPPPPDPPSPIPSYIVKPAGTAATRPLYDGAAWEADHTTWRQIGAVERDQPCEEEMIRKTSVEYRYTTTKAGLRGLAVCSLR